MRPYLLATLFATLASPAFAFCAQPAAVGTVPEEIAAQTDALICQQNELKSMADAQAREVQLQSQLQTQQIEIEQELKLEQQQQLTALNFAPAVP